MQAKVTSGNADDVGRFDLVRSGRLQQPLNLSRIDGDLARLDLVAPMTVLVGAGRQCRFGRGPRPTHVVNIRLLSQLV